MCCWHILVHQQDIDSLPEIAAQMFALFAVKTCCYLCRKLAKQVQTELANANSVADEVLSSMTTVRAHAADDSAKAAYHAKLLKFYALQVSAVDGMEATYIPTTVRLWLCCCVPTH